MTCVDQPMVRRGRWRAVSVSAFSEFAGRFPAFSWWRHARVEDLSDHMLRDIGFFDGRATEASMRRAAGCRSAIDQF